MLSFRRLPQRLARAISNLGLRNTAFNICQRIRVSLWKPDVFSFRSKYAATPVWCRRGTSDTLVFGQIFVAREYRCLDYVVDPEVIIDCGANVGHSAVYFLSRFPSAQVVCIEPDDSNFAALLRNTDPYKDRVTALQMGVWARSAGLVVERGNSLDGREWSFTVREASNGEKYDVQGIDMETLLAPFVGRHISILKIDVEGAERIIFAGSCDWLGRVDNLVIELHGAEADEVFTHAISSCDFHRSTCDELTVCAKSSQ